MSQPEGGSRFDLRCVETSVSQEAPVEPSRAGSLGSYSDGTGGSPDAL